MATIVTDDGFFADDRANEFLDWTEAAQDPADLPYGAAVEIPNSLSGEELVPGFDRIAHLRICFPSHVDGRGFTLARHLRRLGYAGRLRASGHLLADQYVMARRCGFDEVEIDDELARRQPETVWQQSWQQQTASYQFLLQREA